jgi:hypothetical protein
MMSHEENLFGFFCFVSGRDFRIVRLNFDSVLEGKTGRLPCIQSVRRNKYLCFAQSPRFYGGEATSADTLHEHIHEGAYEQGQRPAVDAKPGKS